MGFLCYDAVACGEEEVGHGAEEPPRPDLLLAVHGGGAAAGYWVGHYHDVWRLEDFVRFSRNFSANKGIYICVVKYSYSIKYEFI